MIGKGFFMDHTSKFTFIFPGQGAQYPGMGKEFYAYHPLVRETFEEADDILGCKLSKIILEGPEDLLTQTKNSQTGIFVTSVALLRVVRDFFSVVEPTFCAGLSLGEYTALYAGGSISFQEGLMLVKHRGEFMNDACESTQGTMAVVLGLSANEVEEIVKEVNLPHDLWAANFNCPGQVVISGTMKGIEQGSIAAKERGAKRVLPLQVYGAFHSGLMSSAEEMLKPYVEAAQIVKGNAGLVMNVTGTLVSEIDQIKRNLISQVTHPVRWEQSIRYMADQGTEMFVEIGCGKTLAGFNKRIAITAPTVSIEQPQDLESLASYIES